MPFDVCFELFGCCQTSFGQLVTFLRHFCPDVLTLSDTSATPPADLTSLPATASPHAPDDSDPALITAERGDLLVHGFFCRGRDAIFDIRLQDLDAQTHINKDPQKCLVASEDAKQKKYQKKCHEQRRDFVPFALR